MAGRSADKRLSFAGIRTNSVYARTNLVTIKNLAQPYTDSIAEWPIVSLHESDQGRPDESGLFAALVDRIVEARTKGQPVIWSMGAHVIKNGLSRYIIEMVREGILTHVSGNGATSIHDFELAFLGETSEDVARAIEDGSFGMWEETGRYMNEAIQLGAADGLGYGESLYRFMEQNPELFPYQFDCVFAQCQRYGVPYTCHISIGTDIIHQHPIVDFEALGRASGRDFQTMCQSIAGLDGGGVFLNFGSAISGPEVFLKGLSLARNAGYEMKGVTAANFDIVPIGADSSPAESDADYYYRPRRNFIDRLQEIGGAGYLFHGLHQITIPQLFKRIMQRKREQGLQFAALDAAVAGGTVGAKHAGAEQTVGVTSAGAEPTPSLNNRAKLYSIRDRRSKLHISDLLQPGAPAGGDASLTGRVGSHAGSDASLTGRDGLYEVGDAPLTGRDGSHAGFDTAIPHSIGISGDQSEFQEFAERLREAQQGGHEMLASLGGNVIGSGVSLFLIELMERGAITHLAVNGACAFQDFELAAFGHTDELYKGSLASGQLGMWREPGELMHKALREGYHSGLGFGQSLIRYAQSNPAEFPYLEYSLMGCCGKLNIPYTVHVTIGTDAIQQHPDTDFAIQGGASGRDFECYAETVSRLEGGVFLNFGSTVTGPEVFLKALSIARNLGFQVNRITTANFDLVKLGDYHRKVGYEDWDYYYRPRKNIIHRPTSLGGKGYHFEGLHQITIPAIWEALKRL